jgi:hypothetical protein
MPEGTLDLETQPFDTPPRDQVEIAAETLSVSVDGFEGPLDLLLMLARTQKVDLRPADAPGTGSRLSGDGGLAGLSEIAPAAAAAP